MGETWHYLNLFQALTTMMNLQIVNNLFDNSILFEIFMLLALTSGLIFTTKMESKDMNKKTLFGDTSIEFTAMASLVVFRIFLYM